MESSVSENCSQINFTNKTCLEFSEYDFRVVVWLRTGFSSLGAVVSIVVIACFIKIKLRELLAARLALYLSIMCLINGIVTAIQIVPVSGGLICDHVVANSFCTIASIMITYSVWTILILMFWIFVTIVKEVLPELKPDADSECFRKCTKCCNSYYYDGCVLAMTLILPIAICFIPLKNSLYGLAGAWCWIKARDDECQKIKAGFTEQLGLWYVWAVLFILVFLVGVPVVLVKKRKKTKCDLSCSLFIPPLIFTVIYVIGFANRIIYASHETAPAWLWKVHGVADALVSLVIAIFIFPFQIGYHCWHRNDQQQQTQDRPGQQNAQDEEALIQPHT